MTSFTKLAFAFLFAGLTVIGSGAQTTTTQSMVPGPQTAKIKTLIISLPPSATCPVAMTAQHGADGGMIAVSGKAHRGIGQQLELTLNNTGSTAISAIRITVNGWDGNRRALPAAAANSADTTASRTIELKVRIAPHKTTEAYLWVSGLTSVDSIDLIEVRYSGGLNWRASASHACRIVPDAETLISHR